MTGGKSVYCHEQLGESVSIRRVRHLHNQIRNETLKHAAEQAAAMQKHKRKHMPKDWKRLG